MSNGKIVELGTRRGKYGVCIACTIKKDSTAREGLFLVEPGPPSRCPICTETTIELTEGEVGTLHQWLMIVWALGYDASTKNRAAAEGFAAKAVTSRLGAVVTAMREAGLEPDGRAAADLTRLVWDVEDSILESAEKAAKRRK